MIDILLKEFNGHFIGIVRIISCTKDEDWRTSEKIEWSILFLIHKIHFENECCNRLHIFIEGVRTKLIGTIEFNACPSSLKNKTIILRTKTPFIVTCNVLKAIFPGETVGDARMVNTNLLLVTPDDNSTCLANRTSGISLGNIQVDLLPNTFCIEISFINDGTICKRQFIRWTFTCDELHCCHV